MNDKNKTIATKIALSYTTYNIFLLLLYLSNITKNKKFVAFLQGNSFLIACAVLCGYIFLGITSIIKYYRINYMPYASDLQIILFDIVIHVFPVLLVGLPTSTYSLILPWLFMVIWFIILDSKIQQIYIPWISFQWYTIIILGILPFIILLYSFWKN